MLLSVLLVCSTSVCVAARTASAKWGQTLDGSIILHILLKRGKSLCNDETAEVVDQTLHFVMMCSDDSYELHVPLAHAVDATRTSVRRERAYAVVTLMKMEKHQWWSNPAKHPEKFKKLLERDFALGDPQPDPDDDVPPPPPVQVGVDAAGNPLTAEEMQAIEDADADMQATLEKAQAELRRPDAKVTKQTIAKLKKLRKERPQEAPVALMLGYLHLKKGDDKSAVPTLRAALELAPDSLGAHQSLAQLLAKRFDATSISEATELYRQGSRLMPTDAETYYQLGRMLNMRQAAGGAEVPIGGKSDEACVAWRTAVRLKPDMSEAHSMIALRLAKAPGKKAREVARQHAARAVKIAPDWPMSYAALGHTIASLHSDMGKLKSPQRDKAIFAFRSALAGAPDGTRLTADREAEARHVLGYLLATKPTASKADGAEALQLFRSASEIEPHNSKHLEAVSRMEEGIEQFKEREKEVARGEQRQRVQAAIEHEKELQATEDAEWEADEQDDGFVDIR